MPAFSLTKFTTDAFQKISNGAHNRKRKKKTAEIKQTHRDETKKNEQNEKADKKEFEKKEREFEREARREATRKQTDLRTEMNLEFQESMKQFMQSQQYGCIAKKTLKQQLRNRMQSQKRTVASIEKNRWGSNKFHMTAVQIDWTSLYRDNC